MYSTNPDKNHKKDELEEVAELYGKTSWRNSLRERSEILKEIVWAKDPKPAEAEIGEVLIFEWMIVHGADQTLKFLSSDKTNSNAGWKAGVIVWLEKLLSMNDFPAPY